MDSLSLIKYQNAELISHSHTKDDKLIQKSEEEEEEEEDILDTVIIPKKWEDSGCIWFQHVSRDPATRLDVINLEEKLDKLLKERQARDIGICPIREALYNEAFDEIIRQVTVNCSERGLLLLRIKNELKLRLDAYSTLYESSIAFGLRKTLMDKNHKNQLIDKIEILEEENFKQKQEIDEYKLKLDNDQKKQYEERERELTKYKEEISYLKNYASQLKDQLEKDLA